MPDRNHANRPGISQLVDDPVDADSVRPKAGKPASQLVAGGRITLENSERVEHGICQQEVQLLERITSRSSQEDPSHYSRSRAA